MSKRNEYWLNFVTADRNKPKSLAKAWKLIDEDVEQRVKDYDKFAWGVFAAVFILGSLGFIKQGQIGSWVMSITIGLLVGGHYWIGKIAHRDRAYAILKFFGDDEELRDRVIEALRP